MTVKAKRALLWIFRVCVILCIILWMSVIFGFSAENGEESQSLSDKITVKAVYILNPNYDDMTADMRQSFFDKVSFFVRKTGHFCEYGILGAMISILLLSFEKIRICKKYKRNVIASAAVFSMMYAATDEFHQGFVSGRSPKVMDVCIDTAGALTGAVILIGIFAVCCRLKTRSVRMRTDSD